MNEVRNERNKLNAPSGSIIGDANPWVDMRKFKQMCDVACVDILSGERDNATDGHVHLILRSVDTDFEFEANRWNGRTEDWSRAVDFIQSNTEDAHAAGVDAL